MAWFFLGLFTLIGGLVAAELLVRMSPKRLMRILFWIGAVVGALILILLIIGFRSLSLAALAGIALALLSRAGQFSMGRPFGQGGAFQSSAQKSSTVETKFVRMSLDHENDNLDGEVLAGRFVGQKLSALGLYELLELRDSCLSDDTDSVPLLEAFLDRVFGQDWRNETNRHGSGGQFDADGSMSAEQALSVLGLEAGATEEDIRAAHRRLMKNVHPDQGGSDFLARQINLAKDVLLGK